MAIKKNLLWDPSDLNNPQTLFNTKKYYANQDFIYGSDLNLILAPLTHALQFYPLYNDNNTRNVYNTDTSLLTPYNASGQTIEQKPTLFRLTYQGDYNGDVNVVFDNSKSGYNTNVLIDGNYYGTNFQGLNFIIPNKTSLNELYDTVITGTTYDSELKEFVRNTNYGYDYTDSYTEVYGKLRMKTVYYDSDPEDPSTTVHTLVLNANNESGTLVLKPGTVATMSDLNTLKPTSSGWRNITDPNENPFAFNNTKADVKGVYLIEVRDDDQTGGKLDDGYAHASVVVSIDTENDARWKRSSFGNDSVVIGIGSYTNTIENVDTQSDPALVKSITYTPTGYDAVAYFKYDDSVGGMGYYLEFDGANRNRYGATNVLKFNRFKVTKLFDL